MPELDRFYREAADKAAILAVAPASGESAMRNLVMQGKYTYPILLDQGDLGDAYNVRYVPAVFVIDASGDLVKQFEGGTTFAQLNQLVDDIGG